jgi:creatinine amidohydrolase
MMQSGYWQDLTSADLLGVDPERSIALLPLSAVEQHGPHLPLCTDAVINEGVVRATLRRLGSGPALLVLPQMTVGHSLEHTGLPGTLTAGAETLLALWTDIGRSVARAGVRKLILFNSHGGQRSLVDLVALRLRAELGMLAVRANYFAFGAPAGLFDTEELRRGIHGGEAETSLVLHLRPELVRREAMGDFRALADVVGRGGCLLGMEKPIGIGWMSRDLHPAGVCGNAGCADAERGARLLAHLADCLARLVQEVAEMPLSMLRDTPIDD